MKVVVALLFIIGYVAAANWGVLVAGSRGYSNYRHQSDICHAYQILHKNGIPDSNIIVMQYNDLAQSGQNPFKGKIFNQPNGKDVYAGCPKDYTGNDCTADNFYNILTGNSVGGKKVLKSTANDNVFVFYSDHGSPGLVAMPVGNPFYATRLMDAIKVMGNKKMYKKMVFYVEACESGSMFSGLLPTNTKVYATTAANPTESSWAYYCPPQDKVDGKSIGSCLGDEYSISWMEDSDRGVSVSLATQFNSVKSRTKGSHVMTYGDQSFNSDSIFAYQGSKSSASAHPHDGGVPDLSYENTALPSHAVNSRDVKLHYHLHRYLSDPSSQNTQELQEEIKSRAKADEFFNSFTRMVMGADYNRALDGHPVGICDERCCQPVVNAMYAKCGGFDDYSLKYVRTIVNMCELTSATDQMLASVADLCA